MIKINENLDTLSLSCFNIKTFSIESKFLKDNPLGDPALRKCPVLIPKRNKGSLPLVVYLSGFTGNSSKVFNQKFSELNFPQILDRALNENKIPRAYYLFVDAMTFWGGSQFLNSRHSGQYEDYIAKELVTEFCKEFDVNSNRAIMGGSSGGYGALHLASAYPKLFSHCIAIAPDCDFERSLLPDFYQAMPLFEKIGGWKRLTEEFSSGRLMKQRNWHSLLNCVAMTYCYTDSRELDFPVDLHLGEIKPLVWRKWKQKDPVVFLVKRRSSLKALKNIYLSVGRYDQFNLQYGCRKIKKQLEKLKVNHTYTEFNGSHFDIGEERVPALIWLKKSWRK